MADGLRIGGEPALSLRALDAPADGPAFLEATVLPGRGMMLLQARLRLASGEIVDGLAAPDLAAAARALSGGPDDFAGNSAFSFGGAILAPYANRIRGRPIEGAREIEAVVAGRAVRLPRNWGGKAPGAEQYAMHGLILDARVTDWDMDRADRASGLLKAGDFGGRWPGRADLEFLWSLEGGVLRLRVTARNVGDEPLPMGLGWHPYFALHSGDRGQARLRLPARLRAQVNNYDEVLPTGVLEPVASGPYDFSAPGGRALGGLYLDDCFAGLEAAGGKVIAEIFDPGADLGLRIAATTPHVQAFQVYAPLDRAFVALEPQFNLADPYGAAWAGQDTGMALIPPGGAASYQVDVTAFALGSDA